MTRGPSEVLRRLSLLLLKLINHLCSHRRHGRLGLRNEIALALLLRPSDRRVLRHQVHHLLLHALARLFRLTCLFDRPSKALVRICQ